MTNIFHDSVPQVEGDAFETTIHGYDGLLGLPKVVTISGLPGFNGTFETVKTFPGIFGRPSALKIRRIGEVKSLPFEFGCVGTGEV